jgi:hypothetical protein
LRKIAGKEQLRRPKLVALFDGRYTRLVIPELGPKQNLKTCMMTTASNNAAVDTKEAGKCTICLGSLVNRPAVGSMCIKCACDYEQHNKSQGVTMHQDPATREPMEQCPYCEELINGFTRTFHYSACSHAPADVVKYKADIFNEAMKNRQSRQKWKEYVERRKSSDPDRLAAIDAKLAVAAATNPDFVIWKKVINNAPGVTDAMKKRVAELQIQYPDTKLYKYLFSF